MLTRYYEDGFSGATPLETGVNIADHTSFMDMFLGFMPGSIGETSKLAILIGAGILIFTSR